MKPIRVSDENHKKIAEILSQLIAAKNNVKLTMDDALTEALAANERIEKAKQALQTFPIEMFEPLSEADDAELTTWLAKIRQVLEGGER